MLLECEFASSADLLTIYSREVFSDSADWQENINRSNSTWIFDVSSMGRANLIIDFHQDGNKVYADFYDDQNGDGKVAYSLIDDEVIIDESRYWTVRVIAEKGWWLEANGLPNMNLNVLVDGPTYAAFGIEPVMRRLALDGNVDFSIQVVDENADGLPDWEWRDVWPTAPASWSVYRSLIMVNTERDEPGFSDAMFLPFMGTSYSWENYAVGEPRGGPATPFFAPNGKMYGMIQGYNYRFPPIQIHWESAKIAFVGEFVASRGSEHNWFLYSIRRVVPEELVDTNFEAPFGFFDMANDSDGLPELQVRVETLLPEQLEGGTQKRPLAAVRHSWDQDNDNDWDYKVDTLIPVNIEPTVLGDLSFRMVPYQALDKLVREPTSLATFVVNEEREYPLTPSESNPLMEGIYEFSTSHGSYYLSGLTETPPLDEYYSLPNGQRGEYRLGSPETPTLYVSSIDRKLHMVSAQGGLWKLASGGEIRYEDLNRDGYIDYWGFQKPDSLGTNKIDRHLMLTDEYILIEDEQGLSLTAIAIEPGLFESLPPSSHKEWKSLKESLDEIEIAPSPDKFRALFDDFKGPQMALEDGTLRSIRPTEGGVRFLLEVGENYRVVGDDLMGLSGFDPGTYAITIRGEDISIVPFSPARLTLDVQRPDPAGPAWIAVSNEGAADALGLWLIIETELEDGSRVELDAKPVDALAGETVNTLFTVPSNLPAGRSILARLETEDGQTVAASAPLANAPLPADRQAIFTLERTPVLAPVAALFSISLVLAAILTLTRRPEDAS